MTFFKIRIWCIIGLFASNCFTLFVCWVVVIAWTAPTAAMSISVISSPKRKTDIPYRSHGCLQRTCRGPAGTCRVLIPCVESLHTDPMGTCRVPAEYLQSTCRVPAEYRSHVWKASSFMGPWCLSFQHLQSCTRAAWSPVSDSSTKFRRVTFSMRHA